MTAIKPRAVRGRASTTRIDPLTRPIVTFCTYRGTHLVRSRTIRTGSRAWLIRASRLRVESPTMDLGGLIGAVFSRRRRPGARGPPGPPLAVSVAALPGEPGALPGESAHPQANPAPGQTRPQVEQSASRAVASGMRDSTVPEAPNLGNSELWLLLDP